MAVKYEITNEELFKQYKDGDESKKEEMLIRNEKLCYHIAKKYKNTGLEINELASIAKVGMLKAFNAFDLSKNNKFATFAGICMSNEILMFLRQNNKYNFNTTSLYTPIARDDNGKELTFEDLIPAKEEEYDMEDYEAIREAVDIFLKEANDIDKEILNLYYIENKSQYEVSQITGISQSYVSRKAKLIKKQLINIVKKGTALTKKEESEARRENDIRYTKENYVYIFNNYPQLTNKDISIILGGSVTSICHYRYNFKKGIFNDVKQYITDKMKEKIDNHHITRNKSV